MRSGIYRPGLTGRGAADGHPAQLSDLANHAVWRVVIQITHLRAGIINVFDDFDRRGAVINRHGRGELRAVGKVRDRVVVEAHLLAGCAVGIARRSDRHQIISQRVVVEEHATSERVKD